MAFVYRHPKSRYWYARFLLPTQKYASRSTRSTDYRTAQKLAEQYELPAQKLLTEGQARKVMSDIYEIVHGKPLAGATVQDFFTTWLKERKAEVAEQTHCRYVEVAGKFLTFLGEKVKKQIAAITADDATAFRDSLVERLSITSANVNLKILKVIFSDARRRGLVPENVIDRIRTIRDRAEKVERRAFTEKEIRSILKATSGEWRGMILFGLYTGQRLKDIATLKWQNIDRQRNVLSLMTSKTNRRQILPMHPALSVHLGTIRPKGAGDQPLFPHAYEMVANFHRTARLSNEFYSIMVKAGLVPKRQNRMTGHGRSTKRKLNEISFHSLRHTATSLMKNAGIGSAIVQDVIGHDSSAVSAHYTHIDEAAKRKALDAIPDLTVGRQKTASVKGAAKKVRA